MGEFNIVDSKIEQLSDSGNNVKISSNSAPLALSGNDIVQTVGAGNTVEVGAADQPSFAAKVWEGFKNAAKWTVGGW